MMESKQYSKILRRLETMYTWKEIIDPSTGWIASKTTGWTADSFSGGLEVDFSAVIPIGTKAIILVCNNEVNAGSLAWRKSGDTNISNTPFASSEFSHILYGVSVTTFPVQVVVWLSATYKVQFAVTNANQDIYISYPIAYLS